MVITVTSFYFPYNSSEILKLSMVLIVVQAEKIIYRKLISIIQITLEQQKLPIESEPVKF